MSAKVATITAKRSGIYHAPAQVEALQNAAGKAGLIWIDLPLKAVSNKKQFLSVCKAQLKLPSHFGDNWDALADCVRDADWLGGMGYVLHVTSSETFAKSAPGDYQTALDVLREAADYWKEKGSPFVVLIDGAKDLPAF